jgi:hypothetical protein
MAHYTLTAIDGADDDGGTLYVLYDDEGRMLGGAAWPQPLEQLARLHGFAVVRQTYHTDRTDNEVPTARRRVTA